MDLVYMNLLVAVIRQLQFLLLMNNDCMMNNMFRSACFTNGSVAKLFSNFF